MWGMRSKEECTVKSVFEASIVSTLEAILWLLILGLRCDQGCKDNPMVPLLLVIEHGTNTSCFPVYTIERKMDKFPFFPSLPPSLMGRWGLEKVFDLYKLLSISPWNHSLLIFSSCSTKTILRPLLTLVIVLSTFDFIQEAKCPSFGQCSNSVVPL